MKIIVRDIWPLKEVILEEGGARISLGLLDYDERRKLAADLREAADNLYVVDEADES